MPLVVCSFDNPRGKAPRISPVEGIAFLNTLARLYGWRIDSALGCYRGQCEHSLVIDGHQLGLGSSANDPSPEFAVLWDLLLAAGQETLVHVDSRHRSTLLFLDDGRRDFVGVWSEVTHDLRPSLESWTLVDHHLYTTR